MQRIILFTLMTPLIAYATTYGPVEVHTKGKKKMQVYLHTYDGYQFTISDDTKTTEREAVALVTGDSEVLGDNIYKAWYDYDDIVVYVTHDNTMSVIYPVRSICALSQKQSRTGKNDTYVGTYPNPNYRMEPASFLIAGPGSPHCSVFTRGKPHKADTVKAQTSLVQQK